MFLTISFRFSGILVNLQREICKFMEMTFIVRHESWELALVLFAFMMIFIIAGLYLGRKYFAEREKDGNVLASLFAILGLMLAFTFGMSLTRYEKRIDIMVEESNNIGTAVLRADLYPEEYRQQFRADFKQYVEVRIAYFAAGSDTGKILAAHRDSEAIQKRLWDRAAQLSANPAVTTTASMQMVPALNEMIDITNTRWRMNMNKVPEPVLYLLLILICICAFELGYTMSAKKRTDWLGIMGVVLLVCTVVHLIMDLDRSRRGVITLEEMNQSIVDLRGMFK